MRYITYSTRKFFRTSLIIIFVISMLVFLRATKVVRDDIDLEVKNAVQELSEKYSITLGYMIQDLLHLEQYYYALYDVVDQETLESLMINYMYYLSEQSNSYDQVRLLNKEGLEQLRVDVEQGESILITDLQDKSDRYYFQDVAVLDDDTIYISQFDLNIEHGELELVNGDYVEMVRLATPLYIDDEFQGIIILNTYSNLLFENSIQVEGLTIPVQIMNDAGFYIRHENPEIQYGFMTGHLDYTVYELENNFESLTTLADVIERSGSGWINSTYIYQNNLSTQLKENASHTGISAYTIQSVDENIYYKVTYEYMHFSSLQNNFYLWTAIFVGLLYAVITMSQGMKRERKESRQSIQALKTLSERDSLTGLYNRLSFNEQINKLHDNLEPYTLIFGDLNRFKYVNDTYGHDIGDLLLIHVGQRLVQNMKEKDFVYRFGGDEFVMILVGELSEDKQHLVIERIQEEISKPFFIENLTIEIGISLGHSVYTGKEDVTTMINSADDAMFRNKKLYHH